MLGSAATVTIAWSTSFFISQVFIEHEPVNSLLFCFWWLAIGGLAKALVIWLQEFFATRAAAAVKLELRGKLFDAINKLGPGWLAERSVAEINLLATSGLDSLEPYFAKYLPQLIYTAMVTPIFVGIIWLSDFSSGVTLLVTLPLIPLFMILIGWATRSIQDKQLQALTLLSRHFLEVLRGLTTLKIFRRVDAQKETLSRVSKEHRVRTMKVLRVTFLSGFALELIASLAVALIAVSIGLRLLNGDLTLGVGLFVLLLAPEAYLPLRQVGAQFHASAEGVAASSGILDIIDEAQTGKEQQAKSTFGHHSFKSAALNVVSGPSGIGKSSIFNNLLGFGVGKPVFELDDIAWMPQVSKLFAGTVAENIEGPNVPTDQKLLAEVMRLAALDDLVPTQLVGPSGTQVSGGQAQRICLARTFYRAKANHCLYLLLDEPISALDEARASQVIESIQSLVKDGVTVVAISHQDSLMNVAEHFIEVQGVE